MRTRSLYAIVALALATGACSQEEIGVHKGDSADYNHASLVTAVDKFVAAGRTPDAYADLAHTVADLRPGMDRTVAAEAELKLVVLALGPVQAVAAKPIDDQVEALALTVWPTLLAPRIESDELVTVRDPNAALLIPRAGETPAGYLERLCGGPLASDCKQVVPELQGQIVAAVATRRATERVRNAVSDCVMCSAEPGWHEAVRAWEAIDRLASAAVADTQRRGDPDNWPIAGGAAEVDPKLPEAEIDTAGAVVIGGQKYGSMQRVDALKDLRGDGTAIALHLRPELSLAQVRGLLGDAKRAGATRIAVIARNPSYPWERRAYWIAEDAGPHTGLRPTDSLQLLLHAVDAVSGPGTVARVD